MAVVTQPQCVNYEHLALSCSDSYRRYRITRQVVVKIVRGYGHTCVNSVQNCKA